MAITFHTASQVVVAQTNYAELGSLIMVSGLNTGKVLDIGYPESGSAVITYYK